MAEQIVLVCDTCGRPATGAVNFSVVTSGSARNAQRFTKDLCDTHLSELIKNARRPRRGRRRGTVASDAGTAAPATTPAKRKSAGAAPRKRGRPRKTAAKSSATPRRRGRPRKSAAPASA